MRNKVLKILLAAVVAFGLWVYVITVVSPGSEKTYYDIPVILQNHAALEKENLIITEIKDNSITMQLSGNRTDLNELNESNINIFANLVLSPGTHKLNYTINFPGNIASNAVTILSKEPDMIEVKIENKITKEIPVEVEYSGSVKPNFWANKETAELDYDVIKVTGPESMVSQIHTAKIKASLEGKTESIHSEYPYTLHAEDGTEIVVDEELVTTDVKTVKGEKTIRLDLDIVRYKDVRLKLTWIAGAGATEQNCEYEIKPKQIRVTGSEEALAKLSALELGQVDLGELLEDTTLTFPINMPEGVTSLVDINEATVEIKFPKLLMKTVSVNKIELLNVPRNMEYTLQTREVEVTFRGLETLLTELQPEDVKLTVDLAKAEPGTLTLVATVVLDEQFADAGVIGNYTVTLVLREKPPAPTELPQEE